MKDLRIAKHARKARVMVEYENGRAFKSLAVQYDKTDSVGAYLFETQDGFILNVSRDCFPYQSWRTDEKTLRETIFYQ